MHFAPWNTPSSTFWRAHAEAVATQQADSVVRCGCANSCFGTVHSIAAEADSAACLSQVCKACGVDKPASEFYRNRTNADGLFGARLVNMSGTPLRITPHVGAEGPFGVAVLLTCCSRVNVQPRFPGSDTGLGTLKQAAAGASWAVALRCRQVQAVLGHPGGDEPQAARAPQHPGANRRAEGARRQPCLQHATCARHTRRRVTVRIAGHQCVPLWSALARLWCTCIHAGSFLLPQVCTKCNDLKPAGEFNRDKTKADGLQFRCKVPPSGSWLMMTPNGLDIGTAEMLQGVRPGVTAAALCQASQRNQCGSTGHPRLGLWLGFHHDQGGL